MIKKIITGVVLNGLALYLVTKFVPDITYTGGIYFFLIGGFVIGVLNSFVKPIMKILSLPFVIMTAGLFLLAINAILFWLTVKITNVVGIAGVSVTVSNPWTYLIGAIVLGIVNWAIHIIIHK
ncbi:hypothetical protein GF340_00325 [Candidatus Peregrinibacteria bacterium]|nr:hypothetical protein [Candidatus Peregrinibacteria bacterium]